ncbi:MAG: hypothetical protein GF350_17360 [Chitinivibrionales bacterium]|nr:hypothetical protein [Chitinivibrionales bacterium]
MKRMLALFLLLSLTGVTVAVADETVAIRHGGTDRSYLIHVPPGYDISSRVPLVLDFHGWTSNPSSQALISGFRGKSDEEGFIVAWPEGLGSSWNAGGCCPPSSTDGTDDVGFVRAVVEDICGTYSIDSTRVYATGLSNGSAMTQRLANDAADIFAAAAGFAFYLLVDPNPSRPIAVINFHGYSDATVPYDGFISASAQGNFQTWADVNNCSGTPVDTVLTGTSKCETCVMCDEDVEVTLCSIEGGHVIYMNDNTIDLTAIAWEFLSRFTLPVSAHTGAGNPELNRNSPKPRVQSRFVGGRRVVMCTAFGVESVALVNLAGRTVRETPTKKNAKSDHVIPAAGLGSGFYFLKITGGDVEKNMPIFISQ